MMQAMPLTLKSIQARSASTLFFTFATSVLILPALQLAVINYGLYLALAITILWILALIWMWTGVIVSVRCRFAARYVPPRIRADRHFAGLRYQLTVQRETMLAIASMPS